MLEKLEGLLQSGTIKGLLLAAIPLIVVLASLFGIDEAVFRAELEGWAEKLLLILSLTAGVWAAFQRIYKPTPPLSEAAAQESLLRLQKELAAKGQQLILTDKNGDVVKTVGAAGPMGTIHGMSVGTPPLNRGFARVALLAVIAAASVIVLGLAGCQHTRSAYSAADSPLDLAYVVSEHYAVLRERAADFKESGSLTPEQISQLQAIDLQIEKIVTGDPSATPARLGLMDLARNGDQKELQTAVNAAVEQIANLSRFLKTHGSTTSGRTDFNFDWSSSSRLSAGYQWTGPRLRSAVSHS